MVAQRKRRAFRPYGRHVDPTPHHAASSFHELHEDVVPAAHRSREKPRSETALPEYALKTIPTEFLTHQSPIECGGSIAKRTLESASPVG